MPWRCPACDSEIQHHELEEKPRLHERYRCHICRLELTLDLRTNRLVVAPLTSADTEDERLRQIR
jgi:transposase-like protein